MNTKILWCADNFGDLQLNLNVTNYIALKLCYTFSYIVISVANAVDAFFEARSKV